MASGGVAALLASRRGSVVAAAGCGKTQLLAEFVADERSGRQLVLTHTHAGLAAIKRRLVAMHVPPAKFHVATIAGWCLRYAAAYPAISAYCGGVDLAEDWGAAYVGAERVSRSWLGKRIIAASYDGVLIDEYQDCSLPQHAVVRALSEAIPSRCVGDPLQTIFGFRNEPVVPWSTVTADFPGIDHKLDQPWRWRREGRNARLGDWLVAARAQLETTGRLVVPSGAPVRWIEQDANTSAQESWARACRALDGAGGETIAAILKWAGACPALGKRLGGRWPIVEAFDDAALPRLGATLAGATGAAAAEVLVSFLAERMTGVGPALKTSVEAIKAGRGVHRISKHRDHAERLNAIASAPTPTAALYWLEGALAHRGDWWLYRRECVLQLREALRHCEGDTLAALPAALAAARTRARHRGRLPHTRTIGTPLLVKGLEFDHAVLLWEPDHLSVQGLYVALTRGSKSLTIVSRSRTLVPAEK